MSQQTNRCPGNCGEAQGFGTCDDITGRCTCSMGWTGPDCTDATCCPLWIVIVGGALCVFLGGGLFLWRCLRACGFKRVLPKRPGTEDDDEAPKPGRESKKLRKSSSKVSLKSTGTSSSAKTSVASTSHEAGSSRNSASMDSVTSGTQPSRRSTTGFSMEPGTDGSQSVTSAQSRRTAPPSTGSPQKAAQSPLSSSSQQDGPLRTSAWGDQPPNFNRSQTDAGGPQMGHAQTDGRPASQPAEGVPQMGHARTDGRPSTSQPAAGGPQMGHARTDGGAAFRHAQTDGSGNMGRSKSEAGGSPGAAQSPYVPMRSDAEVSPHVKRVEEQLRDMMDRPLLVRKKTLKELLVEHHPDKNPSEHATEVFQAVNNARSWFLHDAGTAEPQSEA